MKKITYISITLALIQVMALISPSLSHAQTGTLTVAPARQTIEIAPGDSKTLEVKFLNQGEQPISGIFGSADFVVLDKEGTPTFLDNENGMSSVYAASTWAVLPFSKGTITGTGKLSLQVRIDVPKDAKPGGRYFALYFEPTGAIPAETGFDKEAGTGVTTRIAGLVYLKVAGPVEEKALISSFTAPSFSEYGPVEVTTEILNRGNYHIRPSGSISLYDLLGRKISEAALDEQNVFPDVSREYVNKVGGKYMFGKFNAKLIATYGETGQVITATTSFWAFPVRLTLVIILTIIILVLLGIIVWKSLKGRQTKLEVKLEEEIEELESLKNKFKDNLPNK